MFLGPRPARIAWIQSCPILDYSADRFSEGLNALMQTSAIRLIAISVLCTLAAASGRAAQGTSIPDFSSNEVAWIAINSDFTPVAGSPPPVAFDPQHPFVRND